MKRTFGTWATRILRGGCTLTDGEFHIVASLVSELPPSLRDIVEKQFAAYNLAQREVDRRALNFYRVALGRSGVLPVSPLLRSKLEVAPLVRISFNVQGEAEPLHAVLTAVHGRAFSVSFSRPVATGRVPNDFSMEKSTQAWRSNFDGDSGDVALG